MAHKTLKFSRDKEDGLDSAANISLLFNFEKNLTISGDDEGNNFSMSDESSEEDNYFSRPVKRTKCSTEEQLLLSRELKN